MSVIAILEDDTRVADFIKKGLQADAMQVEVFTSVHELLPHLQHTPVDLLILDRMIGSTDTIHYLKTINNIRPELKIIILSALSGPLNRIHGLDIGADDYLEKPFQFKELKLRIQKLLSRPSNAPQDFILTFEDITIDITSNKLVRNGHNIYLSPYEFKLMVAFVKKPYGIYSRTELLDLVWGYNHDTSSNIVDVAIAKLRKKINLDGLRPLIHSIRSRGYALDYQNGSQSF